MDKALEDIEALKDQNREMKYTNGNGILMTEIVIALLLIVNGEIKNIEYKNLCLNVLKVKVMQKRSNTGSNIEYQY